jgi:hypothetical protein
LREDMSKVIKIKDTLIDRMRCRTLKNNMKTQVNSQEKQDIQNSTEFKDKF